MPTYKTFADFQQVGTDAVQAKVDDFLVGYRQTDETSGELKITTADFIKSISYIAEPSSIDADRLKFTASNLGRVINVADKLNEFKSTFDYDTVEAAAVAAKNGRLFIPAGVTVRLTVGGTSGMFNSLPEAILAIQGWHVEDGALVVIKVVQGLGYTLTTPINLNHPFGQNIQIIGKEFAAETNVPLRAGSPNMNLMECSGSTAIGLIDGFQLIGLYDGSGTSNKAAGIKASYGANVNLGPNMEILNFYYGIQASYGSTVNADYAKVYQCGDAGFYAGYGSQISASNSISSNHRVATISAGHGYKAEYGSQIVCDLSTAQYNKRAGVAAYSNSQISANGSYIRWTGVAEGTGAIYSNNVGGGSGVLATDGSHIECAAFEATAMYSNQNQRYGYEVNNNAVLTTNYETRGEVNTNVLGLRNNFATSFAQSDNPTVFSNNTNLNLRTLNGNYINIGASNVTVRNSLSAIQFQVSNTSNAAEYISVQAGVNSSSSTPPQINAEGNNTNIDLRLQPKGSGKVIFGNAFYTQYPGAGSAVPIGYITVKDATGVERKLMVSN